MINKERLENVKTHADFLSKDTTRLAEEVRPVDARLAEKLDTAVAAFNDIRDYITSRGL